MKATNKIYNLQSLNFLKDIKLKTAFLFCFLTHINDCI